MTDHHAGGAGSASAVPASSRSPAAADVVDEVARTELERIRRRWSELSPARTEAAGPRVRSVVEEIAARTARDADVPDLGVPVLAEQLAVVVWDAYAAGVADGIAEVLTALRRDLP